jgi:hypothetical protein
MAITQVANPSSVPSAVADYEAQNAHISAFNNLANNQAFILTNSGGTGLPAIKLGTYIQYGGNLYIVDTEDYAILGTPVDGNNYIRLSGTTTLTAEWVQDISSYVWNEVYGYKESGSYFLLPYLVVKDGTEYEKYSMALDASFGKLKATTLDTGSGAMTFDQGVKTTDSPTFVEVITTNGPNKPVDNNDGSLPSLGIGGFTFGLFAYGSAITIPSGGTYIYHLYFQGSGGSSNVYHTTIGRVSGGTTVSHYGTGSEGTHYISVWRIA